MKTCSKCDKSKDHSEFGKLTKSLDGLHGKCRQCKRDYENSKYGESRKTALRQKADRRSQRNRGFVKDFLKDSKCKDCGISNVLVLEFDHLSDKVMNVSKLVQNNSSIEKIREEIAKCDVVCANCHRVRTYSRMDTCYRL